MAAWDEKFCDERHKRIDDHVEDLYTKREDLVRMINGKFNTIMFGIFATLLTLVGSLITLIVKMPAMVAVANAAVK
jgi:hypothetical protein